jgi:hypothetical protein
MAFARLPLLLALGTYAQDTPHANLLLTLLQRGGVPVTALGNSTGLLSEV